MGDRYSYWEKRGMSSTKFYGPTLSDWVSFVWPSCLGFTLGFDPNLKGIYPHPYPSYYHGSCTSHAYKLKAFPWGKRRKKSVITSLFWSYIVHARDGWRDPGGAAASSNSNCKYLLLVLKLIYLAYFLQVCVLSHLLVYCHSIFIGRFVWLII